MVSESNGFDLIGMSDCASALKHHRIGARRKRAPHDDIGQFWPSLKPE
jgi:hypothetical protein